MFTAKWYSAPEDGRNYRPKHVEPIEIINKLLLLHLVGCLYYCINDARPHNRQQMNPYSCNSKVTMQSVKNLIVYLI